MAKAKHPTHHPRPHPATPPATPPSQTLSETHHGPILPGQVRSRPPANRSQAHGGVHPLSPFNSGSQKFQPLPDPLGQPPYHYDLETVIPGITAHSQAAGKLVFHVAGDTGGIKNPTFQEDVVSAMRNDLLPTDGSAPTFFYHLGDVVYYNGQISDYYDQFYEPYNHYNVPIIGIPGNHDGDPIDASQTSLDGWVAYFMTPAPRINPESHDAPRATLSQPNVYFTLNCPFATIVGMYTNVPEHGSIDSKQQQWLTNEFATAPQDKALIVALHHPIYSFDSYHSGSPLMADAVQHAINDSRRLPNIVLNAHVHNYQRIERALISSSPTPFCVIGNGGYYNLHRINITAQNPEGFTDPTTGAKLIKFNDTNHGYATLTVDADHINGVASTIDTPKHAGQPRFDAFSYSAKALFLNSTDVVSL